MPPRLVAVSKKQSIEKIQLAYREGGLRHFGENYVRTMVVLKILKCVFCIGTRIERQGMDLTG